MIDQYAVFGNPVAQSKSPAIHTCFAEQTGEQLQYSKQLVAEDAFSEAADAFFAAGGKGLNITVPFKHGKIGKHGESLKHFSWRAICDLVFEQISSGVFVQRLRRQV